MYVVIVKSIVDLKWRVEKRSNHTHVGEQVGDPCLPVLYHNTQEDNKMELTEEKRQECEDIANKLYKVFSWSMSDEGHTYWSEVQKKLRDYSKEPDKYCEACGQKVDE